MGRICQLKRARRGGGLFGLWLEPASTSVAETDVVVEQAVQGFGAFGQLGEVAFQRFGERVEQASNVTRSRPEAQRGVIARNVSHIGYLTYRLESGLHDCLL